MPGSATYLDHHAGVKALDDVRVLAVRGDDAASWLQGQLTQDVYATNADRSLPALILDTNGKVRADAYVSRDAAGFVLVLPASVFDATRAGFDRRIVMEDVELVPRDDLALITVQGPASESVVLDRTRAVRCDRLGRGGFDVFVPRAEAASELASLVARAEAIGGGLVDDVGWTLARVRSGVPALGAELGEWTLPQEAALERAAVSFTKGCYVGQEPVVMLEHRGKPPKRLCRLVADAPTGGLPPTGELHAPTGEIAGRATTWVADPVRPGTVLGLGLVKRALAEPGTPLLVGEQPVTVDSVVEPRPRPA